MMVGCLHSSWLIQRSLWKIWASLNVVQAVSSLMVQMHRLRFFLPFVFASRVMLHSKEFIALNWFVTHISGSNLSSHIFQRRMRPLWSGESKHHFIERSDFYKIFFIASRFVWCFRILVLLLSKDYRNFVLCRERRQMLQNVLNVSADFLKVCRIPGILRRVTLRSQYLGEFRKKLTFFQHIVAKPSKNMCISFV